MSRGVDPDQRRVELAEAVFAVIRRDGINSASVRAVAAEAGWTRGVIGHYFADRDDLLLYAYRVAIRDTCDLVRAETRTLGPLPALQFALSQLLPVNERSRVNFQIWLGFMGRVADRPELGRSVLREHMEFRRLIGELVEAWLQAELLSVDISSDALVEEIVVYVDGLGVATALDLQTHSPVRLTGAIRDYLETCLVRLKARI